MSVLPTRLLTKSKLSNYLRAQCDRQLYLSLFKNNPAELERSNLPIPLKTRPSVALITSAGQTFEQDQFEQLISALSGLVIRDTNTYITSDLLNALTTGSKPGFILQPQIEPERYRDFAFTNLGIGQEQQNAIPRMAGLRPDLLFVYPGKEGEYEILPNGERKIVEQKTTRTAISVIDMKNVVEANPSYAAEVCLYAVFLSNWIEKNKLQDAYYVSEKIYLWKHVEMPRFKHIQTISAGANPINRVNALLEDLNEGLVNPLIYMPSVLKFFKEDVPRVVAAGDLYGWNKLEYHVGARCNACDWLGNTDWLWGESKQIHDANPDHYCLHSAEADDHLSKLHSISKGATVMLTSNGHGKVADLVDIHPQTAVLKKHALLKKNKSQIGAKAKAVSTGALTLNDNIKLSGLTSSLNLEFDIIVNFDAGSGFLTGISLKAILFAPYEQEFTLADGSTSKAISLGEEAFVNAKDTILSEWATLSSFIRKMAEWATRAKEIFDSNGLGSVHLQICFWEKVQYEELCNAFGRHLLKILDLNERAAKALAWLFPADELLEKVEELAPGIVFIKDAIELATHLPINFTNTLLGVAEAYHPQNLSPRTIDKYFKEPLSSAIPRERIFEIWKTSTGTVMSFGQPIPLGEAIKKYGDVLRAHAWALGLITTKLRSDFKGRLKGSAPTLNLTVLRGATGVAFDSRLWLQWDMLDKSTTNTEKLNDLIANAETLEASYKAIILTSQLADLGEYRYEYAVSDDSTEAKLEEGGRYFVFGLVNEPGFSLKTPKTLGVQAKGSIEEYTLFRPLYALINVTLESFDRINKKAVVQFRPSWGAYEELFKLLVEENLIPIGSEPIFIVDGLPPKMTYTEKILKQIGNPTLAYVAQAAVVAMGVSKAPKANGTDVDVTAAKVLWGAERLSIEDYRNKDDTEALALFAKTANARPLNESQHDAVLNCARKKLTLIWGPPGTGKTDTLVSFLHSTVREGQTKNISRKILITGPNYRAVEELADRLLSNLNLDPNCRAKIYWAYSSSREIRKPGPAEAHLRAVGLNLKTHPLSPEFLEMTESLHNPGEVTIVATTAHAVHSIASFISGSKENLIQEIFDLVVIDESSQVPVTLAISPLATLKGGGQLVIAGDHLQMPPIAKLQPPVGAEFLVGSIQTYLLTRFPKIIRKDLLTNYRSNQDLVDYAKTIGYPQGLNAYDVNKQLHLLNDPSQILNHIPSGLPKTTAYYELLIPERKVAAFIHDDVVSSQANELEAKLVAGLAFVLRQNMAKQLHLDDREAKYEPFTDDDFFTFGLGVVTPHKAQKAMVVKELRELFPHADQKKIFEAVDTVERFQGGERQTVIVSFGVGDLDIIAGEEAFLLQLERTNVAVSRAIAKCIILMPKSLAYYLPSEESVAETSTAIKSYIEEFCKNRKSADVEFNGETKKGEVRWH